jgi:hypothetical protein
MVTEELRSLRNNGADYIFRNGRLLVGWLACQNQRLEAWLEAKENAATRTKDLRLYTSADGLLGLKDVDELHPALLVHFVGENSEDFVSTRREYRHHFLSERYDDVVTGRYKYSEHEGGELKVIEGAKMFPRPAVVDPVVDDQDPRQKQKQSQKRKRSRCGSGDYELGEPSGKRLAPGSDYVDHGDDDDDDKEVYFKNESTLVNSMDQIPTVAETTTLDPRQHRPIQSQSHEQIATAVSNLDIAGNTVSGNDDKAAEQKFGTQGVANPDPMALTAWLVNFRDTLLAYMKR